MDLLNRLDKERAALESQLLHQQLQPSLLHDLHSMTTSERAA